MLIPTRITISTRRPLLQALLFALASSIALAACTDTSVSGSRSGLPTPPRHPLPACHWATVTAISDGDTIHVQLDGEDDRVRYIGIDAPEVAHNGDPADPLGDEATRAKADLVDDERVCLERDVSDRDRFGRLLRYVWLEDGTLVNETLVLWGYAEAVAYRPDVRYQDSILSPAEMDAMEAHRGIWR